MKVRIRRASDGLVRELVDEWTDTESALWLWRDGNYGCDCNRALLFARAAGEPDPDVGCGSGEYSVESITDDAGAVIYSESRDQCAA